MSPKNRDYDFIVLGSGIAGLYFSLKAAPQGKVAIITKKHRAESNTNYAQGGIAAVTSQEDSIEKHIQDTCAAGAGLCHPDAVKQILTEGPARIQDLVDLGMEFSEREDLPAGKREWDLGKEGGHSKRRILHAKDITGREVERALLQAIADHPNIDIYENYFAIELITSEKLGLQELNRCHGIYVLDTSQGQVMTFRAKIIIMATGGCGKVYLYTTNPDIATGDGVAMAYRAGVPILNMEFVQFHPTCLYHPKAKTFLITEAVRGEGGIIKSQTGREFMDDYHPLKSLAPRDIVARAIDKEMKREGSEYVHLDITHKSAPFIMNRFPNIYETCLRFGIDITKQPIPIVPAAHYQCGGIQTNTNGETSLTGLFAIGEVACTGLHGANRLASNSLLEALVVAYRAAKRIKTLSIEEPAPNLPPWEDGDVIDPDELVVIAHNWDEIRRVMWDYVGIVRTQKRLERAQKRILNLQSEIHDYYPNFQVTPDLLEIRNLATVADLIINASLTRPESRGLHYTLDHPNQDPTWATRDTILIKDQSPGFLIT
ncbi:MAG: L-aspartate oxidase [Verrucomicrobia subdivision 3 bacterium]|nr:L-aspartate oxidase [Limisphaerales bacterium]MCS1416157.1 L-aspartate oxidase [Limisphaerales bacterium]